MTLWNFTSESLTLIVGRLQPPLCDFVTLVKIIKMDVCENRWDPGCFWGSKKNSLSQGWIRFLYSSTFPFVESTTLNQTWKHSIKTHLLIGIFMDFMDFYVPLGAQRILLIGFKELFLLRLYGISYHLIANIWYEYIIVRIHKTFGV